MRNLMDSGPRSTQSQSEMTSTPETRTFFDSLSTDALSIVVKRLNNLILSEIVLCGPDAFDAHYEGVKIPYLAMLFSMNSPFRAAASTLVSIVELNWQLETALTLLGTEFTIGPKFLEGTAEELEVGRNILSACGPYVREICVANVPEEDSQSTEFGFASGCGFVEKLKSHIFQYCRNVEELSFTYLGASVTKWAAASCFMREYAADLRVIEWHGEEDEEGFSDLRECTNLNSLTCHEMSIRTLGSLLKRCGSTLQELDISITPVVDSAQIMEAIRKYCKQLTVLHIENIEDVMDVVGEGSYSSLICSYGSRLEKARTDRLSHESLVEVVKACTSLEVRIECLNEEVVDWTHAYDLGPRIVQIHFYPDSWHEHETRTALKQCTNIRELFISSGRRTNESPALTDEMVANMFSRSSFPALKRLILHDFRANEINMGLIASCTSNLKTATFMPFDDHGKVDAFQIIADSNPHLTQICIINSLSCESLSKLVKMFCHCRKLWFGRYSSNESEVVCSVVPCRGVDIFVTIGKIEYDVNGSKGKMR